MFPPAKKVGFKAPLTEEIKTSKYTLRHSDIESSASTISTLDLNESKESEPDKVAEVEEVKAVETTSPQTGDKRESSDEEDDDDNESYPTTPVAGRRKRHRQWQWTLGPVQSAESPPSLEALQTMTEEATAPAEKEGQ